MSYITKFNQDIFSFCKNLQKDGVILSLSKKNLGLFKIPPGDASNQQMDFGLITLQSIHSAIGAVQQNNAHYANATITFAHGKHIPPTLICELDAINNKLVVYFEDHPTLKVNFKVLQYIYR